MQAVRLTCQWTPLVLAAIVAWHGFLQLCSARHVSCNVTSVAGKTVYRVPEFEWSDCHYSWANSTGHILANIRSQEDKWVATQNATTLTTHGCFEQIFYQRDCLSEGVQHEGDCITNCNESAGLFSNGADFWTEMNRVIFIASANGITLCFFWLQLEC